MDYKLEKIPGGIGAVEGILAAGVRCGLKKNGDKDLALIFCREPAAAAGVFTKNKFKAAPLLLTGKHLQNPIRAVVVNSGNANACTGQSGANDALAMAEITAKELDIETEEVLVSSTGVIGVNLPMEKIAAGIKSAARDLSPRGGEAAARAIMTTDTVPKEYACRVTTGEGTFTIAGMAKGSGMICPDMATMLGFLATDLRVGRELLQKTLREAVKHSFNLVTVDGDTSTNDMVLLISTGTARQTVKEGGPLRTVFQEAVSHVCRELAAMIVKDGEGATKVIKLSIKGIPDYETGRGLARAILNSLLVKTAIFGEDANWGRIITAMGYSGIEFLPELVDIYLGDLQVTAAGKGLVFDELEAKRVLSQREVPILIDLHLGPEAITALGCDLSYEYVTINSSYRS